MLGEARLEDFAPQVPHASIGAFFVALHGGETAAQL
jgi:hypothetical protein